MISISFSSNPCSSTGLLALLLLLSAGVMMVIFGSGSGCLTEFHMKCTPPVMPRVANAIEIESGGVVGGGCLNLNLITHTLVVALTVLTDSFDISDSS